MNVNFSNLSSVYKQVADNKGIYIVINNELVAKASKEKSTLNTVFDRTIKILQDDVTKKVDSKVLIGLKASIDTIYKRYDNTMKGSWWRWIVKAFFCCCQGYSKAKNATEKSYNALAKALSEEINARKTPDNKPQEKKTDTKQDDKMLGTLYDSPQNRKDETPKPPETPNNAKITKKLEFTGPGTEESKKSTSEQQLLDSKKHQEQEKEPQTTSVSTIIETSIVNQESVIQEESKKQDTTGQSGDGSEKKTEEKKEPQTTNVSTIIETSIVNQESVIQEGPKKPETTDQNGDGSEKKTEEKKEPQTTSDRTVVEDLNGKQQPPVIQEESKKQDTTGQDGDGSEKKTGEKKEPETTSDSTVVEDPNGKQQQSVIQQEPKQQDSKDPNPDTSKQSADQQKTNGVDISGFLHDLSGISKDDSGISGSNNSSLLVSPEDQTPKEVDKEEDKPNGSVVILGDSNPDGNGSEKTTQVLTTSTVTSSGTDKETKYDAWETIPKSTTTSGNPKSKKSENSSSSGSGSTNTKRTDSPNPRGRGRGKRGKNQK